MGKETEQKINEGMGHVKPFPRYVQEAISLIDSDDSDNHQIANIIKQDPILAARILSLANSPFFGMSGKVDDIETSCVILGSNIIKNLLVSVAALDCFPVTEQRTKIWGHSIEVASVAELLASKLNQSESKAYIAGLLHDVGKFLLIDAFPEHQSMIESSHPTDSNHSLEEETKMMGTNHARVGAKIIGEWNLPKEIQNIVEMHHNPVEADDYATCSLLNLADELCHKLEMNVSEEEILKGLKNENVAFLDLNSQELSYMLADIKQKIGSIEGILEQLK